MTSAKLLSILLALNLIFPVFKAQLPSNEGYFILLSLTSCLTLVYLLKFQRQISIRFIYFILSVSSLWLLSILLSPNPVYRDLIECTRPILYGSWFYIGYRASGNLLNRCLGRAILISIVFLSILLINQIFQFSDYLGGLYSSIDFYFFNRFAGVFSNPYDLGCYLSLILPFSLQLFICTPPSKPIYFRAIPVVFIFCIFLMTLYSQSRTAFIGSLSSLILILIFNLRFLTKSLVKYLLLLLAILSVLTYRYFDFILSDRFLYLTRGLERFFSAKNVPSFDTRLEQFSQVLSNDSLLTFLLGHGPGFGMKEVFMESQYALYFYRYGFISLSLLILLFLVSSYCSFKYLFLARSKSLRNSPTKVAILVWVLVFPLLCLTNAYVDISRISLIYFLSLGFIFSQSFSTLPTLLDDYLEHDN